MLSSEGHGSLAEGLKKIASRNFVLISLVNFVKSVIYFQMFVVAVPYARETFGASMSEAGFCASVVAYGCLAGRFFSGNLLSRVGFLPLLWFSLISYNLTIVAAFYVNSIVTMCLQRFCFGAAVGLMLTGFGTVIAHLVPNEHRGLGIGVFALGTSLSLALGPLCGIFMLARFGYISLLWQSLVLGAISIVLSLGIRGVPSLRLKRPRPFLKLTSYIDPRVMVFAAISVFICTGYSCLQVFIIPYAAERGLSVVASYVFLAYAVTTVLTRPLSGHIYDCFGEKALVFIIFSAAVLANLAIAYASSPFVLLLGGVLLGLGYGNFQSVGHSISLSMVTPSRFAQATTTFFVCFEMANGIIPFLMGFVVDAFGFKGMYVLIAAAASVSLLLYQLVRGRFLMIGREN